MNNREELIAELKTFQTVKIQTATANRRFTLDEVLSVNEYIRLADFITEQTRLARMETISAVIGTLEFENIPLTDKQLDSLTNYHDQLAAQLTPKPKKGQS